MKTRSMSTKRLTTTKNISQIKLPTLNHKNQERNKSSIKLETKGFLRKNTLQLTCHKLETMTRYNIQQDKALMKNRITAKAYAVYDSAFNCRVNYNQEEKRAIASLTKMMTLICAIQISRKFQVNKSETYFRASANAASINGTISGIDAKQWITVEHLLYGLMLPSGNDAALVLAQNFGAYLYYYKKGQKSALLAIKTLDITKDTFNLRIYTQLFIKYMNQTAKQFHMDNTSFANPHGLDDQFNYSTAKDLCKLTDMIYKDKQALKYMQCKRFIGKTDIFPGKSIQTRELQWFNTHKLLSKKQYIAGKTGQTIGAGNCLSSIVQVNQQIFYIVVLSCDTRQDRFKDTDKIYNSISALQPSI